MEFDIQTLLFNLILTCVIYEFLPIILRYVVKLKCDEKQAKKISIINSVVIYFLFLVFYVCIDSNQVPNITASIFWGIVSYKILKLKPNETLDDSNQQNELKEKNTNNLPYFSKKFVIIFVLILIIIAVLTNFYIYSYFNEQYALLQRENENYSKKINELQEQYDDIEKQYDDVKNEKWKLYLENQKNQAKINFVDNYVVIVPANTRIYHRYDCEYLDKTGSGLIFNIENAKGQGFIACKHCIK